MTVRSDPAPARQAWRLALLVLCSAAILLGFRIADNQDTRLDPLHRHVFSNRVAAFLDWFLYPIERNTYLRPYFIEQDLRDVALLPDAGRIWAVGSRGKIITSADRGRSWHDQDSGTHATLNGIAVPASGRCGWIVGDQGTILATQDGGAHWRPQQSGLDIELSSITAQDDCRHAWILAGSAVLTTDDGGVHWRESNGQNGAVVYADRSAVLRDAQSGGIAVGQDGGIFITRNAGLDWSPLGPGDRRHFADVAVAPGGTRIWAVDTDGSYVEMRGDTTPLSSRYLLGSDPAPRIAMADDLRHGVIVGSSGKILATRDGGKTWTPADNPASVQLNAVAITADGRFAVAVGPDGGVIASDDGGQSWFPAMRGNANIRSILIEPDGRTIWAAANGPILLKSTDGGDSWTPQLAVHEDWLNGSDELKALQPAADGTPGWIAGHDQVFRSRDGGRSWTPADIYYTRTRDIRILPDGRGWAVGEPHGAVRTTRDGGDSWVSNLRLTRRVLTSVAASPDGQRVWAVGRGPVAGVTEDGGEHWRVTPFPSGRRWIGDFAMTSDGLHGCAVGDWGAVVTTEDGGRTWINAEPGTRVALNTVALLDDGRGWIGGSWGMLLATEDFGRTWREQPEPLRSSITAIAMRPDGLGFVGGFALNMARTTDGGRSWTYFNTYRLDRAPWVYAWTGFWVIAAFGIFFWRRKQAGSR